MLFLVRGRDFFFFFWKAGVKLLWIVFGKFNFNSKDPNIVTLKKKKKKVCGLI